MPSGSAVVIPWGYIVCEKACNAEDVVGLRWTCIGDEASPPFLKLASYMAPDGQGAKSNSTAALLAKVLRAIETKDKPVALEPASQSGGGKGGDKPIKIRRPDRAPLDMAKIMQDVKKEEVAAAALVHAKREVGAAKAATQPAL